MAHYEWSGMMNADGTKQMVLVDDPADVAAKEAAQNATTPGDLAKKYPGGYSLEDYMTWGDVGTYADQKNQPAPKTLSGEQLKAHAAEEKKRAKAKADAKALYTAPGTPGPNRISGNKNRPWSWASKYVPTK